MLEEKKAEEECEKKARTEEPNRHPFSHSIIGYLLVLSGEPDWYPGMSSFKYFVVLSMPIRAPELLLHWRHGHECVIVKLGYRSDFRNFCCSLPLFSCSHCPSLFTLSVPHPWRHMKISLYIKTRNLPFPPLRSCDSHVGSQHNTHINFRQRLEQKMCFVAALSGGLLTGVGRSSWTSQKA